MLYAYTHIGIDTCISLVGQLVPGIETRPLVSMSTPTSDILVSNTILQLKRTGLLGEMDNSSVRTGKEQDEFRISSSVKKEWNDQNMMEV